MTERISRDEFKNKYKGDLSELTRRTAVTPTKAVKNELNALETAKNNALDNFIPFENEDKKKKHKYGAERTEVDGITFDSKKEANRYQELKILERYGDISKLELQPEFKLEINNVLLGTYIADFKYLKDGKEIIEDVKGMKTPIYKLKKKLVFALYGIEIFET